MKIILTGASGLVGSNFAQVAARRGHEVIAVVGGWTGGIPGAKSIVTLDLADEVAVQRAALDLFPDAIVNAAAISEPAQCDAHPETSHALNVALPAALAKLAHHFGARMIHLSSEQAFDGTCPPYRVSDPVSPINRYARQKVESEKLVAQFAPETSVTVRLPLLGGNSLTGKRSLHERLFAAWAAGKRTRLYRDEMRAVCTAENVAEVLVELCERTDCGGTITHWTGAESLSRTEMGRRIAEHFKLPAAQLIEEAMQADDAAGATRQRDLTLDCAPLDGRMKTRRETFAEMLDKLAVPVPCRAWYHSGRS